MWISMFDYVNINSPLVKQNHQREIPTHAKAQPSAVCSELSVGEYFHDWQPSATVSAARQSTCSAGDGSRHMLWWTCSDLATPYASIFYQTQNLMTFLVCGVNRSDKSSAPHNVAMRVGNISAIFAAMLHFWRCQMPAHQPFHISLMRLCHLQFGCNVCNNNTIVAISNTTRNCYWACVRVPPYVACCWQRLIHRVLRHAAEALLGTFNHGRR